MQRRSRKKVKDLVDMLQDPDGAAYVGGDFEDYEEQMEQELLDSEKDEETEGSQD